MIAGFKPKESDNKLINIKSDFIKYKLNILMGLFFYEFNKFKETEPGKISLEDFAKSLITYANFYKTKELLTKIKPNDLIFNVFNIFRHCI